MVFFAAIVGGVICKTLDTVMIPVIISIMLAFVLLPVIKFLSYKLKCPWVLSCVLVIILFVILFFGVSSLLLTSLSSIVADYPKYEAKFMTIYEIVAKNLGLEFDEGMSFIENLFKNLQVREYVQKAALFLSSGLVSFGRNFFLVMLLSVFLLIEMRLTKLKMKHTFSKNREKVTRVTHQIVNDTMRYASIKFIISLATGILAYLNGCYGKW